VWRREQSSRFTKRYWQTPYTGRNLKDRGDWPGLDALGGEVGGRSGQGKLCSVALFAAQEAANGVQNLTPTGRGTPGYSVLALPPRVLPMRPSRGVGLLACGGAAVRAVVPALSWLLRRRSGLGLLVAGVTLAGCALDEGPGQLAVDPGRYQFYHCNDLATRMGALQSRENELRSLMAKASEGGGGTVIGALAYRADYEAVLSEQKMLQRTAAEKKCPIVPPTLQSDQTVR